MSLKVSEYYIFRKLCDTMYRKPMSVFFLICKDQVICNVKGKSGGFKNDSRSAKEHHCFPVAHPLCCEPRPPPRYTHSRANKKHWICSGNVHVGMLCPLGAEIEMLNEVREKLPEIRLKKNKNKKANASSVIVTSYYYCQKSLYPLSILSHPTCSKASKRPPLAFQRRNYFWDPGLNVNWQR